MNNIGLKDFWRQTYKTGSPVPLVISIQVCLFVLIYFLDLLFELKIVPQSFLEPTVRLLSLPSNFSSFIAQPWSLVTSNFVYVKLWTILFDSLWLYWVGQIFFYLLKYTAISVCLYRLMAARQRPLYGLWVTYSHAK